MVNQTKKYNGEKSVIFDLDGTLLNTIEDLTDAMNTALMKMGYPTRSVDECKYLVGEGPDAFARGALPPDARKPANVNLLINEYRSEYAKCWTRKTRPYPAIIKLLNELYALCILTAVLSNKRDELVKQSVSYFLPGASFVEIRGSKPSTPLKPDPTSALILAENLGALPNQVLFVGDTKTDMQTARSAGMIAIGVLWGFRKAEELKNNGANYLVSSPMEILSLIKK